VRLKILSLLVFLPSTPGRAVLARNEEPEVLLAPAAAYCPQAIDAAATRIAAAITVDGE
jgi:hypothetical protein